jgi:hypothetical protein
MKKSQNMPVWLSKIVLSPGIFPQAAEALAKGTTKR